MITNGLKSLNWNSFKTIKQDLLYFDKIYFDNFSLTKFRAIREWTHKISSVGEYLVQKGKWDEAKDVLENIEFGVDLLQQGKSDIETKVEELFLQSNYSEEHKKTEAEIEFLLQHKLIDTINPHNYFSLFSNSTDKTMPLAHSIETLINQSKTNPKEAEKNNFTIVPNLPVSDAKKFNELSSIAVESLFYSVGDTKIPLFKVDETTKRFVINGQDIGRWSEAQMRMLKILTMFENEIDSDYHYVPIFNQSSELVGDKNKEKDILKIVLTQFPTIDYDTPFEKIIEFRENSENRLRLLELRRWVQTMSKSDLNTKSIKDEIEYLLEKYRQELKLRKIKFYQTPLEILVVTSLDILSNTLKLNWGEAAKKLFAIKKDRIDYLIDLDKLVGKEIAYIHHVDSEFTGY